VGQTSGEIKDQIDQQREQLGQNLAQLEQKVKDSVDWRTQFEQRPMAGVGLAFGAGVLLSLLMPGGDSKSSEREWSGNYSGSYVAPPSEARHNWQTAGSGPSNSAPSQFSAPSKPRSPELSEIAETVDNIKGALLGLAATRLRSYLAQTVPGFQQEYEEAAKQRGASSASRLIATDGSPNMPSSWQHDVTGHGLQASGMTNNTTTGASGTAGTNIADTAISGTHVPTSGDATAHPDSGYRS